MAGNLEFGLVAKNLRSITQEIRTAFQKLGVDIENSLNKSTSSGLKNMQSQLAKIGTLIGSTIVVRWFTNLSKGILTLAGNLEQAKIAFETMLGSADKADKLLNDLTDFAKKTPFELTGIRQNAKQLLAMGVSAENLLPTLKALGDVSAGLSVPLERIALNYGQVISQGKLTGRELRDFAIAGVPILEELANMLGKTKAEITDMISDSEITADLVVQAFQRMSGEGGKFANLMDKQSQTLQGSRSNLRDAVNNLGEVVGSIFIPALTALTQAITPMIDRLKEWVQANPEIARIIGIVVTAIVALIGVLWVLAPAIGIVSGAFGLLVSVGGVLGAVFLALMWPLGLVIAGVALLTVGAVKLTKAIQHNNSVVGQSEKAIKKLDKQLDKLKRQYEEGSISADQYNKKVKELEAEQQRHEQVVKGSTLSMEDNKQAMIDLANTEYTLDSSEFRKQRAEIIANINALRQYKAELLNKKIMELQDLQSKQKVEQEQPLAFGGSILTSTDIEVNNLGIEVMALEQEIAKADDQITNFDQNIEDLRKQAEEASKPVEDLGADFSNIGGGGGGGGWSANKASEAIDKLEESVDDLKDGVDDMIDKNKEYEKVTEDLTEKTTEYYRNLANELRDVVEDIEDSTAKYEEALQSISDAKDERLKNNTDSFIRSQVEKQVDLENRLANIDSPISYEDYKKIDDEIKSIKANLESIASLDPGNADIIASELDRAKLNDQDKAFLDFQAQQQDVIDTANAEAEKTRIAYEQEQARLEQKKRILDLFNEYEFSSAEEIDQILADKRLEQLTSEEYQMLESMALERKELLEMQETKLRLQRELSDATIQLQQRAYALASQNIDALSSKYRDLITTINQAISAQNRLNSTRTEQRYLGGPVRAGTPYLVGENPDGSVNGTTEMFVPGENGTILNAEQTRQALAKAVGGNSTSSIDNSKSISTGDIHFTNAFDFEARLNKQRFRM